MSTWDAMIFNGQLCPQQDSQEKDANPVKSEEAKLKAKYPNLGQKPGGSDFLMKRLQKGVSQHLFSLID